MFKDNKVTKLNVACQIIVEKLILYILYAL